MNLALTQSIAVWQPQFIQNELRKVKQSAGTDSSFEEDLALVPRSAEEFERMMKGRNA